MTSCLTLPKGHIVSTPSTGSFQILIDSIVLHGVYHFMNNLYGKQSLLFQLKLSSLVIFLRCHSNYLPVVA